MDKQQELDRGYPQSDPYSKAPPQGTSWLAMVLVSLGLIAGLLILAPTLQFILGS
ncbi:hypothetical protein ACYFX5_15245 [Bremerella sp. T1]|uniref:hypothetical protein n=1 Tax=Bremerella sp. TYQ1 TaxID=3119568 RepID=UPI001CCB7F3A|nr:hypothetical protein [Bremerella volcania]UBM34412.1 hypothetical protein LA756_17195 [Bremerella volcania]